MTVHHFPASKKYSDIKVLVQDLIADYPDVTEGIIVLFNKESSMLQYQVCSKSQLAFAGADLIVKSARDDI